MSAASQRKVNGLLMLNNIMNNNHLPIWYFLPVQDHKQTITIFDLKQCTIAIGVHRELIVNPTGAESSYVNINLQLGRMHCNALDDGTYYKSF